MLASSIMASKAKKKSSPKSSPKALRDAATYVYCVVKANADSPRVKGSPKGLVGADKPRLVDAADGYWLLASSAPLSLYSGEAIDAKLRDLEWVGGRAAEHEAVVEHAATIGTVIPMKLFTLFANDERAIDHVRKMKKTLDRVVTRIEGCEEWGLQILFDEARAARAAAEEARSKKVVSGTGFLQRKKALDEERRSLGARGAAQVDELYDSLSRTARRAQRRAAPNRELAGRVLLDAVFLVPRPSVKAIKKTVFV
jgi:hypothetical protein